MTEKKPSKKKEKAIIAYKAFDKDLKCRDFQYAIGETYKHDGEVSACNSGFHSCENPLDILTYYPLVNGEGEMNRFAVVEATGSISKHGDDSKLASAKITIKAELMLPELVKTAINFVMDFCKKTEVAGYSAQLAASGNSAQLAASGDYAQLAASGYSAKLAASGNSAKLAASGDYAKLAASGDSSLVIGASLNCTAAAGDKGCIVLARWDDAEKRYRVAVGYVGENGIEANVVYKINSEGELVKAS